MPDKTKNYGVVTATSIVIANMIGSGIFLTSGLMAANLPNAGWVILCWFFGGMIALAGALSFAELATRIPESGGEFIFLKKLFHPILGFLSGWVSFIVGFSVAIALSAMGFSEYLFSSMKGVFSEMSPTSLTIVKKLSACLIIIIFTSVHYLGSRLGSRVQNLLTTLKIVLIIGLSVVGLIAGQGSFANIQFNLGNVSDGFAFGTAMMMVMFAYSGWNASAYITGELRNPRRTVPLSLVAGTVLVMFLYIGLNIFIFHSTPYVGLQGKITVVETASISAFGPWITNFFSAGIAIMMLSSLSAFLIIGPRVYAAMAKEKMFFPFAENFHKKYQVPGRSIIIQGITAGLMVISGSFEQLMIYMGFALGIFPIIAVMGLFKARKKKIGDIMAVKTPVYPLVPVFYLSSSFLVLVIAYLNRPIESTVAIGTVMAGIPCYYLFIKKK